MRAITPITTVTIGLQKESVKRVIFGCFRTALRAVTFVQERLVSFLSRLVLLVADFEIIIIQSTLS